MNKKDMSIGEALDIIMAIGNYPGDIEKLLNKRKKEKGVKPLPKKRSKKPGSSESGFYFLSGPGRRVMHYTKICEMFARYFEKHNSYPEGCGDILERFMAGIDNNVTVDELERLESKGMFEFYREVVNGFDVA